MYSLKKGLSGGILIKNDTKIMEMATINNLLNYILLNKIGFLLDLSKDEGGVYFLELLLNNNMQEECLTYLEKCIEKAIPNVDNIFRDNCIAINILKKFVEICLNNSFDKNSSKENLLKNLLNICNESPKILRQLCKKIFDDLNAKKENLGYRGVCSLVVFRFYLASMTLKYITNKEVINECKRIQKLANFNEEEDFTMQSYVNVLTEDKQGNTLNYKITHSKQQMYLNTLREVFSKDNLFEYEFSPCIYNKNIKKVTSSTIIVRRRMSRTLSRNEIPKYTKLNPTENIENTEKQVSPKEKKTHTRIKKINSSTDVMNESSNKKNNVLSFLLGKLKG